MGITFIKNDASDLTIAINNDIDTIDISTITEINTIPVNKQEPF
jgi:hypothetical protein